MVTPRVLAQVYASVEALFRERGYIAGKSGRHMKFPYTLSAKIAQFPIFYYFKNNPIWTYYPFGWVVAFYCFAKIHKVVNSDANKKAWAETQRKQAEKEHH